MPDPFHLTILAFCSLVFFILGAYVAGGIMFTSVNLTDEPASWVSALSTFFAALGTIFTLVLLIYQNIELRRSQREETLKREAHEQKQQGMWEEQREMLTFQKLQMHKSLFNDLLNELEVNNDVKFYNRTELYKRIFPDNNFNKFSAQVLPQSIIDAQAGSLQDSKIIYEKIMNRLADYEAIQSSMFIHDHLHDISRFIFLLNLTFPNPSNFGDVYFNFDSKDYLIINIFDRERTLSICDVVLQHLCDFAGLEHSPVRKNIESTFYTEAVNNYFLLQYSYGEFTINLGQIRGSFIEIYKLITQIPKDSELQDSAASGVASFIELLFINKFKKISEKKAIKVLLPQTRYLHELLEEDYNSGSFPNEKQKAILKGLNSCNIRLAARLKMLEYFNTKK